MNERSHPKVAPASLAVAAADAFRLLQDPDVRRLVAYAGAVAHELGYGQAEADMAALWRAAAEPVNLALTMPTFDELQRRRYGVRRPANRPDQRATP